MWVEGVSLELKQVCSKDNLRATSLLITSLGSLPDPSQMKSAKQHSHPNIVLNTLGTVRAPSQSFLYKEKSQLFLSFPLVLLYRLNSLELIGFKIFNSNIKCPIHFYLTFYC